MRLNQNLNQMLQSDFPSVTTSQGAGYQEENGQRSIFEAEPRGQDQFVRDNMPFGHNQVGNVLGDKFTLTQIQKLKQISEMFGPSAIPMERETAEIAA